MTFVVLYNISVVRDLILFYLCCHLYLFFFTLTIFLVSLFSLYISFLLSGYVPCL